MKVLFSHRRAARAAIVLSAAMLLSQACQYDSAMAPLNSIGPTFDLSGAANGTWTTRAAAPTPLHGPMVAAEGGTVYAIGGDNYGCHVFSAVHAYDATSNSWASRAPMPTPRSSGVVAVAGGLLYAIGGQGGCGPATTVVEAYNPGTNSWATRAPMPQGRSQAAVGTLNGLIYVAGGGGPAGVLSSTIAYDPASNTWSSRASMPVEAYGVVSGVVDGKLYVIGGANFQGNVSDVQIYDPPTDTWSFGSRIPTQTVFAGGAVLDGLIYVIGGADPTSSAITTVLAYDPAADQWASVPPISVGRNGLGAVSSSGVIYAIGGALPGGPALATNEAFTREQPEPDPQQISFTSTAPSPATLGGTFAVSATGGASGQPVVFSSLTPTTCSITSSVVSLDAVGTCTVAADQAGTSDYLAAPQLTQSFAVVFAFVGFSSPVSNLPATNIAQAGRTIPMKFSLSGDQGLSIFVAGSPESIRVDCSTVDPNGASVSVTAAGLSELSYDATTDDYSYSWKTEKAWAGTCRQFLMKLNDGTTHRANFFFN